MRTARRTVPHRQCQMGRPQRMAPVRQAKRRLRHGRRSAAPHLAALQHQLFCGPAAGDGALARPASRTQFRAASCNLCVGDGPLRDACAFHNLQSVLVLYHLGSDSAGTTLKRSLESATMFHVNLRLHARHRSTPPVTRTGLPAATVDLRAGRRCGSEPACESQRE